MKNKLIFIHRKVTKCHMLGSKLCSVKENNILQETLPKEVFLYMNYGQHLLPLGHQRRGLYYFSTIQTINNNYSLSFSFLQVSIFCSH